MSPAAPRGLLRPLLLVLAFAVLGAGLGVVWAEVVWSPPSGRVADHTWYPTGEQALSALTDGTSSYIALSAAGGLVLGVLAALAARRHELLVLGAVLLGGAVAAYLMWQVGTLLGPPDQDTVAARAPDGTAVPGRLDVAGLSPFLTLPTVALAVLTVALLASPGTGPDRSVPGGNRSA